MCVCWVGRGAAESHNPLFSAHRMAGLGKRQWFKSYEMFHLFQSLLLTTQTWERHEYFHAFTAPSLKCVGNNFPSLTHRDISRMNEVGGKCP